MLKRKLYRSTLRIISAFAIIILALGVVPANPVTAKPILPPEAAQSEIGNFQFVDTPVGFWKFDEGSGTTAGDSSGFGNNGTIINGPTWTTGQINGALNFDGANDYVAVPDSSSLSLDMDQATFAAWIRADTLATNWSTIMQRSDVAGTWFDWQIYARAVDAPTANHPVCRINIDGTTTYQVQGDIVLQPNTWYFLACTYDGTAMRFYIDGTLRGTTPIVGTIPDSGQPIWIGGNSAWGEFFDGIIDETRIYNRALSDTEIQALMLQYNLTITSSNGTVTKNPNRTTYSYDEIVQLTASPDAGWQFDSWSGDLGGSTNPETITMDANKNVTANYVEVNDPPVNTVPGVQVTLEDTPLVFNTANGNAISVADPDAGSSPIQMVLSITNGTLTLSSTVGLTVTGNGTSSVTVVGAQANINTALATGLVYDPTLNFAGGAVLTVATDDQGNTGVGGAQSDTDTVNITVTAQNDTPTTTGIANVNVLVDAPDTVIDLWPSFADVEDADGQLTYTVTANDNPGLFTSVTVTGAPNQNLVLNYAPATIGTAAITVRATDTGSLWVETTFTVTVSPVNDPPTGGDGSVTAVEDTLFTFAVANFTTSTTPAYSDPEGDPFAGIQVTSLETAGTLQCGGVDVILNGTCADVTTLTFLTALNGNSTPYATFGFKVCDGFQCSVASYTMTINVTPVNDPPSVANLNNDAINYTENDPPALLDVGSDADVSDVDSADFNSGTLTVQFNLNGTADDRLAIQNACGTAPNDISLVGGNVYINAGATLLGSFTGGVGTTPLVVTFGANATPATVDYLLRCISYENVSNTPSTLQRVVRFNVNDGDGGTSANDFVYVNFASVNDAPIAVGETYATDIGTPLVVAAPGVLANDFDPDGNPLTAVKDTDPANGTVILNADGSFTYTPNLLFSGIDSFTYHANDGLLDSNAVTVNIGVQAAGTKLCGSGTFIDKGWEFIFPVGSIPGCIYIYADDANLNEPYSGSLESLGHRIQVFASSNGQPVTQLKLPYEVCYTPTAEDYKKIGGNFALLRIGVFSNGGSNWELLPVTEKKGKACASLDHFSYFDLFQVALPATGFAPDVVTPLPEQAVAYAPLGDLWLEIPRLGVQQAIVGVPLTENGWDVTWLGNQIGYLYGTAYPTGSGNSVLTAHVYDYNGKPGTFAGLKGLWWGDQVIVHAFGQDYVYEVRQVSQADWDSAASVLKHEERPWITLVTCKDYDEATNTYRARVVVRAVLVDVK